MNQATDNNLQVALINDKRVAKDFQGISFSKYKKSIVKDALIKAILAPKIEQAVNWAAELICAGHYADLWDAVIQVLSKHIHLGNPKLPIYISLRFDQFKTIIHKGYVGNELALRNIERIRQLFCELISVLCYSRKKHAMEAVKIEKKEEFNMPQMALRLKAPNVNYAAAAFKSTDPKELFVAINELAYHVSLESRNVVSACYWIEWIMEYENLCHARKEKCVCGESRAHMPVQDKFKKDIIWIVWDVLFCECNQRKRLTQLIKKSLDALLDIFCIKYSAGTKTKRRFVIYNAVSLLTENVDFNCEMISNRVEIDFMLKKVNVIYKVLKKNEEAPATAYLEADFLGLQKDKVEPSNLDKTMKRLEMMDSMVK